MEQTGLKINYVSQWNYRKDENGHIDSVKVSAYTSTNTLVVVVYYNFPKRS